MTCVYCPHPIKDSEVYWPLKCGRHLAHGTHGTSRCTVCSKIGGEAAPPATPSGSQPAPQAVASCNETSGDPRDPQHPSRVRRLAQNAARRTEPLKPYEPATNVEGWAGQLLRVFGRVAESSIPDDESEDPVALLDARIPLQTLVRKHGFDITELINDYAVDISDFFRNGYTIGEMCDAFDSRMNPTEGMRVLYFLGMTDEFISARPDQAQVPIMKARLGFNVDKLLSDLDYRFVAGRWTLPQMLEVGLTMPVVMAKGMQTQEEWLQLQNTRASDVDLIRFGVTPELEARLQRVPLPVQVEAAQPVPVPVPAQQHQQTSRVPTVADPSAILQAAPVILNGKTVLLPVQKAASGATFIPTPLGTRTATSQPSWSPTPSPAPVQAAPPQIQPRVDTTPKLVDRSALPILVIPQQQQSTARAGKFALK